MPKKRKSRRKREKTKKPTLTEQFKGKGIEITERIKEIILDFKRIRNAIKEIKRTGNNALFVAGKENVFPDKIKAVRIGYSILYVAKVLEELMDRLEKICDEEDMERFTSIIKSPAFSEYLILAWRQCREGNDDRIKERYELIFGLDGLESIANRYNIRIKPYSKISKADVEVEDIKKIKPNI